MGRQPLPAGIAVTAFLRRLLERQRNYIAHPDPAAAMANFIAILIVWNGPFYPIYVIALVGWAGLPSFLTMLSTPFFFSVPWLMRRDTRLGRAAMATIGIANTAWSIKLFGAASAVNLFLLPCMMMGALLYRRSERRLMLAILGLAITAFFAPAELYGAVILPLTAEAEARLANLNLVSVTMLTAVIAMQFAVTLRGVDKATAPLERVHLG